MINKAKKKIEKRYAELKGRFDGTFSEKIKKAENALYLYEQTYSENLKQKTWLVNYLKKIINYQKTSFYISKTITRTFYPKIYLDLDSDDSGNLSVQKDSFIFKDIRIPLPINKNEKDTLSCEFIDLIMPYLFSNIPDIKIIMGFLCCEGPYELNENVSLKEKDIVIDCGANMGIFSAIASVKDCIVYAFEPFPYVIENYLSKTAKWHKNINICEYALWDNQETLDFSITYDNIGSSSLLRTGPATQKIKVQAIQLDDFAHKNNLTRVDFIKADIEGAERNMLRGAKQVLKEFAPKLSICTYHLPDDLAILREIILDANPNYKITEEFKKMYAYV